jgi:hypothetical protein
VLALLCQGVWHVGARSHCLGATVTPYALTHVVPCLLLHLLLLLLLLQAEAEWRRHDRSVRNIRQVVRMTDKAVRERWEKYHELFDNVSSTVSNKFMAYMHRRGHAVRRRICMYVVGVSTQELSSSQRPSMIGVSHFLVLLI